MQAIRAGDLYFLDSPFHVEENGGDGSIEKRLSYLLGTASSRPAVVIRAPEWWDQFNTCTVIPAVTKGDPAFRCHLTDRYGRQTRTVYPFVPHNPHTIPVARLGKFIGSLDEDELDELLYAFRWIHTPGQRKDPGRYPVPKMYEDVIRRATPMSWTVNHDDRSDVCIYINKDGTELMSDTNPELNGFPIKESEAIKRYVPQKATDGIRADQVFCATTSPLPDSVSTEVSMVPVERDFPPSIFDKETLNRVASRFTISDAYYNNAKTVRDPAVLTNHEIRKIATDVSEAGYMEVVGYYKTMQPLDAYLLGPRLPLGVLRDITGLDQSRAYTLKGLCNYMRDMPDNEYETRCAELKKALKQEVEQTPKTPPISQEELQARMKKVKPYMTADRILSMPPDTADVFLTIPQYMVQRSWTGPRFKTSYKKAVAKYKGDV